MDHGAAYRQLLAEEPEDTGLGFRVYVGNVLMFGSVASVWSYCRVADLMSWLSAKQAC